MNVPATLSAFKMLWKPSLCLPHTTISTFDQIPIPLSKALIAAKGSKEPDIRAVVLDKDNCFAKPKQNDIHGPYKQHFQKLREYYLDSRLLIVSNSAGTNDDEGDIEAQILEYKTGVKVFRHSTKKPGCMNDIVKYFCSKPGLQDIRPSEIAIIGDRLLTDIMMANMMGAWSVWIKDGVVVQSKILSRMEKGMPALLTRFGLKPRQPQ